MPTFLQVAVDTPLDRLFDYRLPEDLAVPAPGTLVEVPFGRRRQAGVVISASASIGIAAEKLREVIRPLDDRPALAPETLALARFCADYYHHPLGAVLHAALPPRLRDPRPFRANAPWLCLSEAGRAAQPPLRARTQRELLAALADSGCLHRDTLRERGLARHARTLVDAGWAEWRRDPGRLGSSPLPAEGPAPTPGQQAALDALLPGLGRFGVTLLHGVTGSGKTELYLHLIADVLARGRQALVLIPEIALTPQLEQHFRRRFPGRRFALLHSGLGDAARTENWLQAADCDILLGTRLAVFAPLPRLGLIVVDEEHDGSFKQQDGLRYSARDVAVTRGKQRDIPVVLGSATPSLESWEHALEGRYQLVELPQRAVAGASLPAIELVDLRHLPQDDGLTRPVIEALAQTLERGEQSLVFLNRRGYAPALYCPGCGWVAPCPRCSARLVLHRSTRSLKCHHCGHESRIPAACPSCGEPDLKPLGQGTQRLEESLAALLPGARIRRIDRDSMGPRAWAELGASVHGGEVDILVGTQMLAKGHDFPNMTLALVLDCDGALYSPDFRATERLFAQLMQVAGRAGRAGKAGRVLIQTAFPEHPLFRHLQRHDFAGHARELLAERRQLDLPPYSRQVLLRAEAPRMDAALAFLRRAAELAPQRPGVSIFSPVPAPMARVANLERAQLLLQSASRRALQQLLAAWRPELESIRPRVARWSLDVDPLVF
jgi:primosomal protein N' (replication factor Y)